MPADLRLPRYQQLRDDLAAQIARQQWRPGDAIPTEAELAKLYNVAVGTVRKAVDVLVAEGLLERFQGRGTFVRRASFASSLFRFFRFQNARGERRVPESRILKRDVLDAPSAPAAGLQIETGTPVIRLTRLRLLDGAPLLAEEIWLPYDRFEALATLELDAFGDLLYPLYETQCGQIVASAEETLTAEAVNATYARLLRIQAGDPVMVIERVARGYDRVPLEWRRSRGAAAHFRYHVDIR
ncbi:GntR family transcriptional regulator [Ralstonia solanacearum]|uniref:GntR family transcriptional regulator n=1 Tax=Ralstonia solanacearum TaxID=305 RepID=A0AAE3NER8_RALSL|nr:GntR family transcriptional regulator [Ralstonia solanacearum]KFX27969.1 GntR family transcriptional regulator [Ralstonia solanacearum]MBB6583718.1 GntR family transcriptional regulator [Ralstonia solanacearum]MDB0521852.1 GntR family transcriptional regulator [Ralstonia solanacearum]MDC6176805.1 GntR family transcriptional regulator [Ralstonia solanacearum]MDC6210937.1 GntR family transcriptional regulator [Ralstonia solanacearum]